MWAGGALSELPFLFSSPFHGWRRRVRPMVSRGGEGGMGAERLVLGG